MSDDKKDGRPDKARHATALVTGVEARGEVGTLGDVLLQIKETPKEALLNLAAWLKSEDRVVQEVLKDRLRTPAEMGCPVSVSADVVSLAAGSAIQIHERERGEEHAKELERMRAHTASRLAIFTGVAGILGTLVGTYLTNC